MPCFGHLISQRYPQRTCNSERRRLQFHFFANVVTLDFQTNLCSGTQRKTLNCWTAHLDNAPAHNSKLSREALKSSGATRALHPAYNPEITPNDFYLFGSLKEELQAVAVTDRDSLIPAITQIFSDTPQNEIIAVYQNWMKRFREIIKNRGQYYRN
jgi:hypothetical protein